MFVVEEVNSTPASIFILEIRVDSVGQFWWNFKRVSPDNLPELLPSVKNMPDSLGYNLDFKALYNLILKYKKKLERGGIIIKIHPKSHFINLENLLTTIKFFDTTITLTSKKMKIKLNDPQNIGGEFIKSIQNRSNEQVTYNYKIRTQVWKWEGGDNIKINAAVKAKNIRKHTFKIIPEEYTFWYKFTQGYWDENEFEF